MNEAPEQPLKPRRSFLEAPPSKPFLKTPEGRRLMVFAGLFLIAGVLLFIQYQRIEAKLEHSAAQLALEEAAAKNTLPLEERLAQKRAQLVTAFEGAFGDTSNGDGFLESAGYHKLIEVLAGSTPEEITAKATAYLDHGLALEQPDLLRGEFVRVRGVLGGLFAQKLDRPEHNITDVWRGSVSQPDGESDVVIFDLIGEPPALDLQRSVVEVDGLLYRTISFESKTGQRRSAPYLLARNLRVLETTAAGTSGTKVLVIVLGIAVIIGYLILRTSLRARKREGTQPARFKEMFDQRRRAARAQQRH